MSGELFGKAANATGVFKTEQNATFSKAIQEAATGTTNALKFGTEPANIAGEATLKAGGSFFGIN